MSGRARYHITHETHYRYSHTVASGRQLAHLTPRVTSWQDVRSHRIEVDPSPAERADGTDYFGNPVVRFAVDCPHDALLIRAESVVDVESHAPAPKDRSPAWESALAFEDLLAPENDLDLAQYRVSSPMGPVLQEALDYARPSFDRERPWLDALMDLTRRIKADFVYDPTATTVTTPVVEVLGHRHGVCQDFAHLMISCLRSLGLPARYVSGYVLNSLPAGKERLAGADASHAWVAAHCPDLGWVAFDPTNGKLADIEFVTVSWGRDFSDVTPLRGVVLGSGEQELAVRVAVEAI